MGGRHVTWRKKRQSEGKGYAEAGAAARGNPARDFTEEETGWVWYGHGNILQSGGVARSRPQAGRGLVI
jgi:hypothetical protein